MGQIVSLANQSVPLVVIVAYSASYELFVLMLWDNLADKFDPAFRLRREHIA